MTHTQTVGKIGEDAAAAYLVKNRYRIIEHNHLKPWGEIDIVAKAKDGTLVFIEVKTMAGEEGAGLRPEDNMTGAKIMKMKRAALAYANAHPELVGGRGWRIDAIAVRLGEKPDDIRHYENI